MVEAPGTGWLQITRNNVSLTVVHDNLYHCEINDKEIQFHVTALFQAH